MEKSKLLTLAVISLFLLNLGVLGFLLFKPAPVPPQFPPHGGHHPHGGPGDFIIHELEFNKEQEKAFNLLREQHHTGVDSMMAVSRKLHDELFSLEKTSAPDTMKIFSLADTIAGIQKKIEIFTFHHFQDVRRLCSPEQQVKFDNIIEKVLHQMAPESHGKPPHPRP